MFIYIYLFCSIELSIFSSRYPILYLFVKLSSYFIAFNCLHLYLDSPIFCMPNSDWDPSLYTDTPVEVTQRNNDPLNIPAPLPVSDSVPTTVPVSTPASGDNDNNNNSGYNSPRNATMESPYTCRRPSRITSVLHLNSLSNKARRRFFWYVSESEKKILCLIKNLKNIEILTLKYMLKLKMILRLILIN